VAGDDASDIPGVGSVRVGGVEYPRARLAGHRLNKGSDIGRGAGMVHACAAVRQQQDRATVEDPFDKDPLPRRPGAVTVDLRRAEHADRQAAVEQ